MTVATRRAEGSKQDCKQGLVRFPFTLAETEFEEIKSFALQNHRSISAEIRARLQTTLLPQPEIDVRSAP